MIKHLALIMDGNRRWAAKRALMPWDGHKEGVKAVEASINFCLHKKIPILTLYAFSLENFKRSQAELSFLFALMLEEINSKKDELISKNIKIKFLGDETYFPNILKPAIDNIEIATEKCTSLKVNILFCYGGQQEIVNAVKNIAHAILTGEAKAEHLDTTLFEQYLKVDPKVAPDLVIRTGGAKRLSNFLSYQSAYSELSFIDKFWPDIKDKDLETEIHKFNTAKRNFGA